MSTFHLVVALGCSLPIGWSEVQTAKQPDPEQVSVASIQKSLGVEFAIAESKIRRSITSTKTPYGFKINKVAKDSLAAKADWKVGDVLLEWNEKPVDSVVELEKAINAAKVGAAVKFKIARKRDVSIWSRQPWEYKEGTIVPK